MTTTEYTPWRLAAMADCGSPDSLTSPGAEWLAGVASDIDDLRERRDGDDEYQDFHDAVHELADYRVPVYTHERWQVFVDLAAYNEDVTEYGEITDMGDAAGIALFMIAERLLHALIEEDSGDEGES